MFLNAVHERNPELIEASVTLHQKGKILPDTYVIDLDAVQNNARLLAQAANVNGIELYLVSKQIGRNPLLVEAIVEHIPLANATDLREARALVSAGAQMGNLGHLVQIPEARLGEALSWEPRVMTVYSVEKARSISETAKMLSRVQPILLRVMNGDDFFYPAQKGGIPLDHLPETARYIEEELPFVSIEGVTSFPCLLFDREAKKFSPTPNLQTVLEAKRMLEKLGMTVSQVNLPSATCVATLPMLSQMGATHAEPGHSLTGTTPLHALDLSQPEKPAIVYISEVSHLMPDGRPVAYGGGFYSRSRVHSAFLYGTDDQEIPLTVDVEPGSAENIDYYRTLSRPEGSAAAVGDTAVFSFRTQIFVTRSQVAVVGGLGSGKPELLGLYDALGGQL